MCNGWIYIYKQNSGDVEKESWWDFPVLLLRLWLHSHPIKFYILNIINRASAGDLEKEDLVIPESPSQSAGVAGHCPSTPSKERTPNDNYLDLNESECQRTATRPSSSGCRDSLDSTVSPSSRDSWQGKLCKGSGEPLRSLRLTSKLRDFHKFAKVCDVRWKFTPTRKYLSLCKKIYFSCWVSLKVFQ